jgi:hypothetical protein
VRPLGLGNGAFDIYVIYFSIIVSTLLLGVKVCVGLCHELGRLRFVAGVLGLVVEVVVVDWLCFLFGGGGVIVLHWVGDLWCC